MTKHQLRDAQYGFRHAPLVVLQQVVFLDEIFNRMDNKECEEILALYNYILKTFDKVTFQKLISKLGDMGIGVKLLKLLASDLTDRQQRVNFGQQKSETSRVTIGVPQGSILWLLMFIVYINTLPNCVQRAPASGYADDFKVITSSLQDADQATKSIQQRSKENDVVLNLNKSKILSIRGETRTTEEKQSLEIVKNQKYFGVIMSSNIYWVKTAENELARAGDPSIQ